MGRLTVVASVLQRAVTLGLLLAGVLCGGCASGPAYNPTAFNYQIDEASLAQAPLKKVIIASTNLGPPSSQYFSRHEALIDAQLARYFTEHGIEVLPQQQFTRAYNAGVRAYGNPVDPSTGKVNRKTFNLVIQSVRDHLRQTSHPDAIVFTDIVELAVPFNIGLKHLARWDGVTRKPTLQGPGNTVSSAFNWEVPARVSSLMVSVYDLDLKRLFLGRGGLSATDAIDTRSGGAGFTQRRELLTNNEQIAEGIALALHPLIPMARWPGRAR